MKVSNLNTDEENNKVTKFNFFKTNSKDVALFFASAVGVALCSTYEINNFRLKLISFLSNLVGYKQNVLRKKAEFNKKIYQVRVHLIQYRRTPFCKIFKILHSTATIVSMLLTELISLIRWVIYFELILEFLSCQTRLSK